MAGNELANVKLSQAAALVETVANDPVIVIMSQCTNYGHGQTAHSKGQMKHFGVIIDNKSRNACGKQCIVAPEGFTIPVHVCDGLPRIDVGIPTDF